MAIYEYYCPTCREKFEQRRPMSEAATATKCREGHAADRMLSLFAMSKAGSDGGELPSFAGEAAGGGCCGGGGCGCRN